MILYLLYRNGDIMLSKKKGIPQSKPFTMEILIDAVNNYMKCLNMNCNQEMNIYYRNKYILEMERSIFDFRNNLKNGKADFTKYNNEIAKLKIKAMKEKEREMVVKCYLKNCHNETSRLLKLTIQNILVHYEKSSKEYKLASKYKKVLEKNKLTVEHFNNIDRELILTAEYINLIETELLKWQIKLIKMNKR
jgi:hypothetical protein